MADAKISALPAASVPLAGTEVLPIVQGSATDKVSVANLTAGRAVSGLSFAAGNLNMAGNALTSTSGAIDLRPSGSGFVTNGEPANANWAASYFGFTAGDIYSLSLDGSNSNSFGLASNAYRTASGTPGTWKYSGASTATLYTQDRGAHTFYAATSGSANGTITWTPVISTTAAGNVTVNTGNLVQGTAAKGVNFTANTPAAGMTSQLLNWYEEGTWTPSLGGDTTYTFREGFYTRIGRLITVSGIIIVNSIGTGSTTQISGIPFNVVKNGSGSSSYFENLATSVVSLVPYGDNGAANVLKFRTLTAAATAMSSSAIFQNGTRVDFIVTYSV